MSNVKLIFCFLSLPAGLSLVDSFSERYHILCHHVVICTVWNILC